MTANPGSKVVSAVKAMKAEIDGMTDDMIAEAKSHHEHTKDGFYKVKKFVFEPWGEANKDLDDFVNQLTNGGPPLEE